MTTTTQEKEKRIDKRTKGYKDSQGKSSEGSVESDRLGSAHDIGVTYTQEDGLGKAVAVCTDPVPDIIGDIEEEAPAIIPQGSSNDPVIEKLDEILAGIKILLTPTISTPVEPPAVKEPAMTPVKDFTKCLKCGKDLPPVETPRIWPEACHDCVYKEAG